MTLAQYYQLDLTLLGVQGLEHSSSSLISTIIPSKLVLLWTEIIPHPG
jgi:hypothetical protein